MLAIIEQRSHSLYVYARLNKRYGKALKDRAALALAAQQKKEAKRLERRFGKMLSRECA